MMRGYPTLLIDILRRPGPVVVFDAVLKNGLHLQQAVVIHPPGALLRMVQYNGDLSLPAVSIHFKMNMLIARLIVYPAYFLAIRR